MIILNRKVGERLIVELPHCELTLTVTAIEGVGQNADDSEYEELLPVSPP